MIVSPLVTTTIISPNKNKRNHKIDTITIHVMAGNLSAVSCGNYFANSSAKASSNYGVDSKGKIACYVPEEYRSWATSNASNDHRAITIEVANDGGADTGYHVTDTALNALVELITDVCKRNDIKKLLWKNNKNLIGKIDQQNMTVHRWFSPKKACPGDYLMSKHPWIVDQVNNKLLMSAPTIVPSSSSTPSKYMYNNIDLSPVFDPTFYVNKYPDLKAALGNNPTIFFSHFTNYGMKEARQAIATFNPVAYRNHYPDLQHAFGDNWPSYYIHYCTNGKSEGRSGI